jgi:hypothetical protein
LFELVHHGRDFEPEFSRHIDGWGELQMNWQVSDDDAYCAADVRQEFIRSITRAYCGAAYFFPAIAGADRASADAVVGCSPQFVDAGEVPAGRVVGSNRRGSTSACCLIGLLLNDALTVVPALIAETIEQVTT